MIANNRTVTIIGAGLAGLAAAYDLHRAGCGGEFIEDRHMRMLAYAKQFNLQLGRVGSWQRQAGDWGAFDGRSGRLVDEEIWGTNLHTEIEKMWEAVSGLGKYVPDPKQPQLSREAEYLDAQSALDWINTLDVHPLAKSYFIQHIRSEYTAEPECFSLLDLARNSKMYYSTAESHLNWRVLGGNDLIPRALADALPDVRMNAAVTSIRILPDEVAVTYKQGDSYLTIHSAFAVLAIPLTTARLIDFNSSLPSAHQRMVNEVSYGAVTKVMVQYRKRFWDQTGWNGRLITDSPIVITWLATSHIESEDGIITAYTGGGPGAKLAALSDEARIQVAVDEIEKVFPGSSDLIEHTATVAWPNEPFTRGSYMALAPGEVIAHWQTLFEPAGRLFFAGEHATAFQGYMEGAVESGQRAAASILSS
jgi:monoamine oxidase